MSLLRSKVTLGMWFEVTLLPRGDIGHVTLHGGHHLYNGAEIIAQTLCHCNNQWIINTTIPNNILLYSGNNISFAMKY